MSIDIYTHIITPKFVEAFSRRVGEDYVPKMLSARAFTSFDIDRWKLEARIAVMDKFPNMRQVLTPTGHTLEKFANPDDAAYLASIYNDEMAELILKYPDRFVAAVACLPLNNIDATLKEIDRTINELGFKGILMNTPVNGQPMDSPDFLPIYEKMAYFDLPIWIHPTRPLSVPDYENEKESKYGFYHVFGWPYETTLAMGRLVCSGILARYPGLKFITHHAGAMVPFLADRLMRVEYVFDQLDSDRGSLPEYKSPAEYFSMFYNDTAIYGNTPGLMCAHAFFGTRQLLFGTDMPYGPGLGEIYIKQTIDAIEAMNIPESDKYQIYEENAIALLKLNNK